MTEYLLTKNQLCHDEVTLRKLIVPLLSAASFCHSKGITHSFITPDNFYFANESITFPLIDPTVIKLSNFYEGEVVKYNYTLKNSTDLVCYESPS